MTEPETDSTQHHLLIGGTGRAGTSFLVRYLAELGLQTHLTVHDDANWNEFAQAGLEDLPLPAAFSGLPYVIKTPFLSDIIDDVLSDRTLRIDAVIIPMRDLVDAATSRTVQELRRMHRTQPWMAGLARTPENWGATAGGTVFSLSPVDQARLLALGFHVLVERLTKAEVPMFFVGFPRMAQDPTCLYEKLRAVLPPSVTVEEARTAHARIADLDLVRTERDLQWSATAGQSTPIFPDHDTLDRIALGREMMDLRKEMVELEARCQRTQLHLDQAMQGLHQKTKNLEETIAALRKAHDELSQLKTAKQSIGPELTEQGPRSDRLFRSSIDGSSQSRQKRVTSGQEDSASYVATDLSTPALTQCIEALMAAELAVSDDPDPDYTRFEGAMLPDAPKAIAFYLPQYHPIPENDAWWGKGFTEWTNVMEAKPFFPEHYQPHIPAELGFYDLRVPETRRAQADLARRFGIYGFCYYYYWFAGRKLLDLPLKEILRTGEPDFPFCICWANENWSRRWDGGDAEILIRQEHDADTDVAFIQEVLPILRDPRYIQLDGAPLLIVYRAGLLPDARATCERWRHLCCENGIQRIHLCCVESFGLTDPASYGFDSSLEFPPHNVSLPDVNSDVEGLAPEFCGEILDYTQVVVQDLARPPPPYQRFKGIMVGWDNTARRRASGKVFINSTLEAYEVWLNGAIAHTGRHLPPNQQLVFINAWNEWAEGAHLEPDQRLGTAYLQATARALRGESVFRVPRYVTTNDPDLRLIADGETLRPVALEAEQYVFVVKDGAADLHLVSRSAVPSKGTSQVDDTRLLGVALRRIVVHGEDRVYEVPIDDPAMNDGWHDIESDGVLVWRWTNGNARLPSLAMTGLVTIYFHVGISTTYRICDDSTGNSPLVAFRGFGPNRDKPCIIRDVAQANAIKAQD